MKAKHQDTLVWLYTRGVHLSDIAVTLKEPQHVVMEELHKMMLGTVEYVAPATRMAMERTDWSQREEYILRTMRGHRRSPGDIADFLGRQVVSVKQKWKDLVERDAFETEQIRLGRLEKDTSRDHTGGMAPATKKRDTLF